MRRALLWLGMAVLFAGSGVTISGADFVAATNSPGNAFGAAADFNSVAVSLRDPGALLRGTVTLEADASSERGVASVRFQTAPAGSSSWVDACTDTEAPFTCGLDTAGVADGVRDMRAIAVDQAGYQRISAVVGSRRIDNTLPAVTLNDPGILTGTETLTATGSDAGSGLAGLAIEYRQDAGSWTTLCSGTTSPRSCALASATLADGSYELRARATDAAGNAEYAALTRVVDNTAPTGSIPSPGTLRGTAAAVGITAADGAGSGVARVVAQFRVAGSGTWSEVCIDTEAPYECTGLDTTGYPDGPYEARAIVEDRAGFSTTTATTTVRIDNAAPTTATLTNPGASLAGTVTLSGTAADAGSGIAAWTVQYRLSGATAWTDACSDGATPYSCAWATTGVADGVYELRAVARDQAGNTTASTTRTGIRVDNVVPVVALTDPGSPLAGTVTVAATATDGGGVASVTIERSPAGANTWTAICTDASASYSCAWDTTQVAVGSYDLRARATDNAGRTATSAIVAARAVDRVPRGTDVQATNGGSISGRLEAGDSIRLTYSEAIAPASILSGWTGASTPIRVSLANGSADTMDFLNSAGTTRLGLVNAATELSLGGNFVTTTTASFNATMAMSGNIVIVTLGSKINGTVVTASTGTMTWRPSAAARDLVGLAASTALVTESGTADRDF
ncbi:MAG TPA: Ig-like domain-containing protein [Solirubrobacteraceae bacterium]|nr:Ig-like domain-containing protein [Solirubrobacteraceae bacterium]